MGVGQGYPLPPPPPTNASKYGRPHKDTVFYKKKKMIIINARVIWKHVDFKGEASPSIYADWVNGG